MINLIPPDILKLSSLDNRASPKFGFKIVHITP